MALPDVCFVAGCMHLWSPALTDAVCNAVVAPTMFGQMASSNVPTSATSVIGTHPYRQSVPPNGGAGSLFWKKALLLWGWTLSWCLLTTDCLILCRPQWVACVRGARVEPSVMAAVAGAAWGSIAGYKLYIVTSHAMCRNSEIDIQLSAPRGSSPRYT